MKKYVSLLLALLLILQLAACGGGGGGTGTPGTPEAPETPVNDPEKDPYQTYVYEEGGITLAVPWSLPAEPEKTDDGILFRDPEGAWTVSFEPLTPSEVKHRVHNTRVAVESFRDFGYYADIEVEDTSFGGYPALRVAFSRNPDWVEATMGYTASYTEPHQIYVIDYTDVVIAGWGGLRIDVSAPEKSTADLSAILADPDVQTLLGHVQFAQPSTELTASIPGITVSFPIRWSVGDDGKSTLWGGFQGEQSGNVYVGSTIYADPVEAAGFVREDYRTLDIGGRTWYGGVRHVEMSSSDYYQLLLYTEFTQFHALQVKLNLNGADEAAIWAFAEGEVFRGILESIQLEPDAFQDPEKDRMDASGFECNNINEISAYTGGQADITVPAVIGSNEIVGVNTDVFKNNTALRSVTLEEGIQYIEYGAFRGCTNLETVVLPNSLTYIDSYAFEGCTSLRTVQFGENVAYIGSDAFSGCAALGEVKLPATVQQIGSSAFLNAGDGSGSFLCPAEGVVYGYSALARSGFDAVEIGPGADLSDHHILSEARVNRVVIGPGCRALGEYFLLCPTYNDETGMWHYVDTPLTVSMSGVEQIGDYAFEGRVGLQEIDLTGCKELGRSAFNNTGLVNITVPGTVKVVPESCFANCPNVLTITLEEGVEQVDRYAFSECGRIYPEVWNLRYLTEEEAAAFGDRAVPNGSPDFDKAITIYLPSTLRYADDMSFSLIFINGLYMLWCTEPDMLPDFHVDAFYRCRHIFQFYFTEETIQNYGDELDERLNQLSDVGTPAWYYQGKEPYWSLEPLE